MFLVGDIGGTNADLAIADVNCEIVFKQEKSTKNYDSFLKLVNDFLREASEKGFEAESACFAIAGPLEDERVEMPHTNLVVDEDELEREADLDTVLLINDFDAIGYAVNELGEQELHTVNEGTSDGKEDISVIGAGTGLGKNTLVYDEHVELYLPDSSEGGHADLPLRNQKELELAEFISRERGIESPVAYEQVLSGQGIENIHQFLSQKRGEKDPELASEEISNRKDSNNLCGGTFKMFIQFFGRCAKNFVLDTYSINGVYIAGGIAAANPKAFNSRFMEEFTNSEKQFQQLLEDVPVKVITNYDVSLKGAARALKLELEHKR